MVCHRFTTNNENNQQLTPKNLCFWSIRNWKIDNKTQSQNKRKKISCIHKTLKQTPQKTLHHRRQRKMALDKRRDEIHQNKKHQTHQTTTIQPRTQPNRTILEKHQTMARNTSMVITSRTHKTITNSTQERFSAAKNIPLLISYTITSSGL